MLYRGGMSYPGGEYVRGDNVRGGLCPGGILSVHRFLEFVYVLFLTVYFYVINVGFTLLVFCTL